MYERNFLFIIDAIKVILDLIKFYASIDTVTMDEI